jgi:hypothetical protein
MFKRIMLLLFTLAILSQVKGQKNFLSSIEQNKLSSFAFTRSGNNLVVATTYLLDSATNVNGRCIPMLLFVNSASTNIQFLPIGDTTKVNDEILFPKIIETPRDSILNIIGLGITNYFYRNNDYFIYKIIYNTNTKVSQTFKYPLLSNSVVQPKIFRVSKLDFDSTQIYYGRCGINNDARVLNSFFIKTTKYDSLLFSKIELGEKDDVYGYPLGTLFNRNNSIIAFNHETNKYGEINELSSDSFNIVSQFKFWRGFSEGLGDNHLYSTNRYDVGTVQKNNNVYQLIVCDTFNSVDGLFERYSIRKLNFNNYNIERGTILPINFDYPHDFYYSMYSSMNNALLVYESRNTVFAYLNSINTKQQFILYKFDTALNITWYKDFVFDQNNLYNRYTVEDMLQTDDGVYLIGKITDRSVNPLVQKSFLYFISNDGHVTGINNKELVAFTSYIYPNPAQTNFNIPTGTQKVNIINNVGQLVLNTDNPNNNTVDISMLQPGIYIVQLFINNQWVSNKLVKP